MENDKIQKLKAKALALTEDERASLALVLMRSIDPLGSNLTSF